VTPTDGSSPAVRTHTVDVSESGVMLACVGLTGTVRVSISMPGGTGRLVALGTVVRQEPGRTAVNFVGLPARDAQALRRLSAGHALAA
jgi:hypothetical protein